MIREGTVPKKLDLSTIHPGFQSSIMRTYVFEFYHYDESTYNVNSKLVGQPL